MTDTSDCAFAAEPLTLEEQVKRLQRAYDEQVRLIDELAGRLAALEALAADAREKARPMAKKLVLDYQREFPDTLNPDCYPWRP